MQPICPSLSQRRSRNVSFSPSPRIRSRRHRNLWRRSVGFTLLELLLVLSILVVIGGIVMVNIGGASKEANVNATKTQLNSLKNSIQMYQIRMNSLPETLEALRDGPSDSAKKDKWIAPIINEVPNDAWENPLVYSVNGNTYEIRSGGIDGQVNTDDDIVVEGS
ncbi:type II secretion system protein GspG [Novipirellula artificiosorum]|uniref:Type II secretion system protein G n=1 Tax=Novipirellula artificiosorum TaxID=2528016 RepID=A0A5C6DZN1_9BACT|nr:type II secretion system protein GspG [Novipirellula artificiosorum]TWU41905.1 Type II secretion system protein G precursor [Novipirellula artificiosorum]